MYDQKLYAIASGLQFFFSFGRCPQVHFGHRVSIISCMKGFFLCYTHKTLHSFHSYNKNRHSLGERTLWDVVRKMRKKTVLKYHCCKWQ